MKFSEHRDFEDKERHFTLEFIRTKKEFDEFYDNLKSTTSIWRGMHESKYKHYTSMHRFWLDNNLEELGEDPGKYLLHLNAHVLEWNQEVVRRLYGMEKSKFAHTTLSTWSILQHHGAPTPLLDWTRNPKVALFFACSSEVKTAADIGNYCSIYEIKDNFPFLFDYDDIVVAPVEKEFPIHEYMYKKVTGSSDGLPMGVNEFIVKLILKGVETGMTPFYKVDSLIGTDLDVRVNNSLNIIAQEGLFLINPSVMFTIEQFPEMTMKYLKEHGTESKSKDEGERKKKIEEGRKSFISYEINKGLRPYILDRLRQDNFTKATLFPSLEALAKTSSMTFLQKKSE